MGHESREGYKGYDLEFERDSDLRHWEIFADSNDRVKYGFEFKEEKTGECVLIISDKLIRELYNKLSQRG